MATERWTLRPLADQLVACEYIDNIRTKPCARVLKTNLSPEEGRVHSTPSHAEFVHHAEDVLIVYAAFEARADRWCA